MAATAIWPLWTQKWYNLYKCTIIQVRIGEVVTESDLKHLLHIQIKLFTIFDQNCNTFQHNKFLFVFTLYCTVKYKVNYAVNENTAEWRKINAEP